MKRLLACMLLVLMAASAAAAATRVSLSEGWRFCADPRGEGLAAGWARVTPGGCEAVSLPHTWSLGKTLDYEGEAWYFLDFAAPRIAAGSHVEIDFGAAFDRAIVYLNGEKIGAHAGGFTAFSIDLTQSLRAQNHLAVRLDNRPDAKSIPGVSAASPRLWYDWWHWGGLVREVSLSVASPTFVRRQSIRSAISGATAEVSDSVRVENFSSHPARLRLRVEAVAADGSVAAEGEQSLVVAPGGADVRLSLRIARPQLWSLLEPRLYTMRARLLDERGGEADARQDSFGLRTLAIRDRHLLLNGERVRLTGMSRHADSPWEGMAETRGSVLADYSDMKSLHVNLMRPIHYPQSEEVLDFADRHGILLIPEIPLWQFDRARLGDADVRRLAAQQMREMIEQAGNHPSVFAWSVANESEMATPEGREYFRMMKQLIHELDPQRPVTFADNHLYEVVNRADTPAGEADFLMMNEYFGSWHGPAEALPQVFDNIERIFPDKMLIISEFGEPGIFAPDSSAADRMRVAVIESQIREFARRDWIGGAIFWCYQDYRSHRNVWPGEHGGFVDHGLVDENRQRRPSYYVWLRLNEPAKVSAIWKGDKDLTPPSSFVVTLTPKGEDELPRQPLRNLALAWRLQDADGLLIAEGREPIASLDAPVSIARVAPPSAHDSDLRLTLRLLSSEGEALAERELLWHKPLQGGASYGQ